MSKLHHYTESESEYDENEENDDHTKNVHMVYKTLTSLAPAHISSGRKPALPLWELRNRAVVSGI